MKPYILTRRNLNPSARVLARELGLEKSYEPRKYPPVIRWGNSYGSWETGECINRPEIIHICSNKLRFSRAMMAGGIPHVEILDGIPERFPVVFRANLSGSRGEGISIVTEELDARNKNLFRPGLYNAIWADAYWSYWRNFSSEFGVHFFNGRILRIFKKIPREGTVETSFPIKNMDKGYKFSLVSGEKQPRLHALVEEFHEKFGMTFGRLDVGWNPQIKEYEIIEANSAPGIVENPHTVEAYVTAFKEYLKL